ncbi:hypothetical protein D1B33_05615 [Lysinibacillus yapensis]|uniref:Uncharacterized protein n=1 Tax=Ureibacillus yapensis TaxID=2304605 RepID=A0A396SB53_9BACL|nr:hypothetical protein [Lysinibacillus yapensis]RHW38362.1 hypothetical protein D1B33_05615 [Lysinibacillus yapensis]
MFAVHFYEKRNLLISKLLNEVPSVDSEIRIKGRKGKVIEVHQVHENKYHVQIELEAVKKVVPLAAANKRKRK